MLDYIIEGNYKGIGFDVMGLDPVGAPAIPRHRKLFARKNIINIENLKNLDKLGDGLVMFACLPMKWKNCDGAPARAIACLD